jgi:hypothetical protein
MLAPLARDRWALLQVGVAVVACALFVALLPASGAVAGSAVLRATAVEGQQRTVLSYRADGAEMNHVVLFLDWSKDGAPLKREPPRPYRPPTAYVLDDRALEEPGQGCNRMSPPDAGLVRCPIPEGSRPVGPRIWLGDHHDFACVAVALPGGSVAGGKGSDDIRSLGRLSGGPGDDSLWGPHSPDSDDELCDSPAARTIKSTPHWVSGGAGADYIEGAGQVFGGPGADYIESRAGGGVIVPGPGADEVGVARGGQVIRARDGWPDIIYCSGSRYRETVLADGLDVEYVYTSRCEQWRRRGAARAAPVSLDGYFNSDNLALGRTLEMDIVCPRDGPPVCQGEAAITVPGGHTLPPVGFRVARGKSKYFDYRIPARTREHFADTYDPSGLGYLEGRNVKVTVWSRDRSGILRSVHTVLHLDLEETHSGE